jgi:hypothetical protein
MDTDTTIPSILTHPGALSEDSKPQRIHPVFMLIAGLVVFILLYLFFRH